MRNILLILTFFATLLFSREASAQTVTLKADTVSISCASSDTFLVPVRVFGFTTIGSFQFTLMWDTAKLDYAYTTPLNPLLLGSGVDFDSNTTQINLGKIAYLWTKTTGASLPDSTVIFNLAFRRIGGSFASLMFVNAPVPIEVASFNGDILQVVTVTGGVKPVDDKAPVITCPANVTVQDNGPSPVDGIAPASITDNCAPVANVGWASSGATNTSQPTDPDASGYPFNIGVSTVTYTATDVGNNTATCTFSVTVEFTNTSDTLTIIAQNVVTSCNQTVSVNITALNFDSIGAMQFSFGWNTAALQYSSVNNFNPALQLVLADNFNTLQTASGLLAFLWTTNDPEGVTLPPGAILFTVNFTVTGAGGTNSPITFGDLPVPREAVSNATGTPEIVPAFWINGSVSIIDNVPPILECPDNVVTDLPPGNTNVQVNGLQPTALLDNCGGNVGLGYVRTPPTFSSGIGNANGLYNPGVTTVTYTATDQAGNTNTCSFTVTVNASGILTLQIDTVAADCQANGSLVAVNVFVENWENIVGLQFDVNWDETVLAFDTVGNDFPGLNLAPGDFNFMTAPNGSFSFFGGGLNSNWPQLPDGGVLFTIYFNLMNPGAASTVSFSGLIEAVNSVPNTVPVFTVNGLVTSGADNTPPTVVCPPNIPATVLDGCFASVNVPLPQANDACSGIDSIARVPAGNIFPVGATTVVYTVIDSAGNATTCSLTVTVVDNVPPSVICPANIPALAPDGCEAIVSVPLPTATDLCSGIDTIFRVPSGNIFVSGVTTVVYTAIDSAGNSAACSLTVTVTDHTLPFFTGCPTNVVGQAAGFSCQGHVIWQPPVPTDICGQSGLVVTSNYTPDSTFSVGQTMVTYIVTDLGGNSGSCNFLVTMQDTTAPIIICPSDFPVPQDGSPNCGAVVTFDPPAAFDNCDLDVEIIVVSGDPMSGDTFPSGPTTLFFTAKDDGGNTATCSFTVTVVDATKPLLTCPNDTIVTTAQDTCGAFPVWATVTATDNCSGTLTPVSPFQPGQFFTIGPTEVTYSATDQAGNVGTCSFIVTVTESVPPVIVDCPQNVLITLPPGQCDTIVSWTPPLASDNCLLISFVGNAAPGDTFPAGTTVVTYTATDAAGNTTVCSFSIFAFDQIPPTFLTPCPPNVTVNDADPCGEIVTWMVPEVMDNCTPDSLIVFSYSHTPPDTFYNGETTVVIYAEDASGNFSTCEFKITINAAIQPGFINVPSNDTIPGCAQPVFWTPPTPVGYCILKDTFASHHPGDTFPVGTTIVTYTWVEGKTNISTSVSFEIIIQEDQPPTFTCPTGPIVVNTGGGIISDPSQFLFDTDTVAGCAGVELDFDLPLATDNCGIDTLYESDGLPPGAVFPIGTTTLVFQAYDVSGNTAQCAVVIQVQALPALAPVALPQLGCLNQPVTITAASIPGAVYTWMFGQQTLNNTGNTLTISEFATANEGTYTVSALVNGCPAPSGSVTVELASEPNAVDDTGLLVAPGDTILFNVLNNDVFTPASDFDITFLGTVPGLVNLGNGNFGYVGISSGNTSFFYSICSKSCPNLCDSAIVTITVREPEEPCKVPNIITPNGDELNDFLLIDCIALGLFRDNSLVVYNQWGDKVYETKGYNNNWGGTLNGEPGKDLPDGVYFYVFKPGPGEPTLKGFVEIFR